MLWMSQDKPLIMARKKYKPLLVRLNLLLTALATPSYGCDEDLKALVTYLCEYQLISDTQCQVWLEDLKQGDMNAEIIWETITNGN